jgi:teichuronic acid biosynthesis glycosyltransferase TuaC
MTERNLHAVPEKPLAPVGPRGRKPRVLIYTSLFPNSAQPVHGNFILERMRHLMPFLDMTVVAPVPYFPQARVNDYWYKFATIPRNERFADFDIDHPRYIVIPKIGMTTHGFSMFAGSLRQVTKRINAAEYDLIDAHYVYPDGFAAMLLGARFNKPVVVSARGSDINLFTEFKTIRPMVRKVLQQAARVVAVTNALKKVMIGVGCPAEKIDVIGNGVDAVKFAPRPQAAARRELGLGATRRIILSVGNLNENKGFGILLDAVARLRSTEPDVLLVIVGDGEERRRLEARIARLKMEDNAMLVGVVPHSQLSAWYSAADLFCLASLREGCPNVILEAMACGCPVLATAVGGIVELVPSPSLGCLVDRSPEAFAAAISEALGRDWDRAHIAEQGRGHSWDTVTTRLLNVYSEVLSARS